MKLDKIKFAKLVQYLAQYDFNGDIETVDELIDINIPEPVQSYIDPAAIDRMIGLMLRGDQKIEAIKHYRQLTGQGLKESKDAVERYWVSKPICGE